MTSAPDDEWDDDGTIEYVGEIRHVPPAQRDGAMLNPPTVPTPMTADEFRAALKRLRFAASDQPKDLGLSEAARFFGAGARTVREWAERGPPLTVALMLRLMLKLKLDREQVTKLLGRG